jgi:hypothetical protein
VPVYLYTCILVYMYLCSGGSLFAFGHDDAEFCMDGWCEAELETMLSISSSSAASICSNRVRVSTFQLNLHTCDDNRKAMRRCVGKGPAFW